MEQTYAFNPVTLSFSGEQAHLESDYCIESARQLLPAARMGILFGILIYSAFSILDKLIMPEAYLYFWSIRFYVAGYGLFVFKILGRPKSEFLQNPILASVIVVAGCGIVAMINIAPTPSIYSHYVGLILVFFFGYTVLKIRFVWASLAAWFVVGVYEVSHFWLLKSSGEALIANNFFFISGNLFGMVTSYSIELCNRNNFFLVRSLENRKAELDRINRNLERKVEHRTTDLLKANTKLKEEILQKEIIEKSLKETLEKYRLLAENLSDVVISLSPDGRLDYCSPVIQKFGSYSAEDLAGDHFSRFIADETDRALFQAFLKEIGESSKPLTVHFSFQPQKGDPFPVEVNGQPVLENGKLASIQCVMRDITQRRQEEKQLLQSEKMASLGNLVGGVAHEMSTPLGVCTLSSSFLRDTCEEEIRNIAENGPDPDQVKHFMDMVLEATRMILTNLKRAGDLLKSFKLAAVDQVELPPLVFNIRECIEESLIPLRPQLKRHKHTITIDCPQNLKFLEDPNVFLQIFSQLLNNSFRHGFEGREGGRIFFHVYTANGTLCVRYEDNGIGMNPATAKQIFEPFFTTKRNQGAVGLGMHIVFNLVIRRLKGLIECHSEEGSGTRFDIAIPVPLEAEAGHL